MRSPTLLLLFALTGCGDQRSFNERYLKTANSIQHRASDIDHQLNESNSAPSCEADGGSAPSADCSPSGRR